MNHERRYDARQVMTPACVCAASGTQTLPETYGRFLDLAGHRCKYPDDSERSSSSRFVGVRHQ